MEKSKTYSYTLFDAGIVQLAKSKFDEISKSNFKYSTASFRVYFDSEAWAYDSFEEYLADYRKPNKRTHLRFRFGDYILDISTDNYFRVTNVEVTAPTRKEIEAIFSVLDDSASKFYSPPKKKKIKPIDNKEEIEVEVEQPVIFIGHGQSSQWKDLKDHLHEKHGHKIIAYETGARAGHTIRDILESMLDESSFALLVLTGEDETKDGAVRARQNVIHEAGLFQGSLGFERAIVLLEEGTEEFSNLAGIQQIRYSKGKIIETYGEVLATLRREFSE
jgi:predicted nucleotide-binding protein